MSVGGGGGGGSGGGGGGGGSVGPISGATPSLFISGSQGSVDTGGSGVYNKRESEDVPDPSDGGLGRGVKKPRVEGRCVHKRPVSK